MVKARHAKEVMLRLPNEIGTLNAIAKALSDKGFNILAISAWVEGADVVMRLLIDEPSRGVDTLAHHKYVARQVDVIVVDVPHKPGMLRSITERLAKEEIDVHHLYATAAAGQDNALMVFATANNDRALALLNSGNR